MSSSCLAAYAAAHSTHTHTSIFHPKASCLAAYAAAHSRGAAQVKICSSMKHVIVSDETGTCARACLTAYLHISTHKSIYLYHTNMHTYACTHSCIRRHRRAEKTRILHDSSSINNKVWSFWSHFSVYICLWAIFGGLPPGYGGFLLLDRSWGDMHHLTMIHTHARACIHTRRQTLGCISHTCFRTHMNMLACTGNSLGEWLLLASPCTTIQCLCTNEFAYT
jgi:hypothetical protein